MLYQQVHVAVLTLLHPLELHAGVMVLARGMPAQQSAPSASKASFPTVATSGARSGHGAQPPVSGTDPTQDPAALAATLQAFGGADAFACPADAAASVWVRQGNVKVPGEAVTSSSKEKEGDKSAVPKVTVTAIANRSTAIGMLSSTAAKARAICTAGAYMHWYERYGCGREAIEEAIHTVECMADAYRLAHGVRDFL